MLSPKPVLYLTTALLLSAAAAFAKSPHVNRTDFEGKTYVITGASSGFGRGVAIQLGALGANVVLAARRTDTLNEVADLVTKAGGKALVVTTDVAKADDMTNLSNKAVERFGKIDVWINDVGVGTLGPFEQIPMADHSRMVDVNLKGVIYGSHLALQQFRKQDYGTLINLGSIDSEIPLAYQASYSATKCAVLGLDRALNEEIRLSKQKRIKVATIMPFAVDTPWWNHAANYSGHEARFKGMNEPDIVVNGILRATVHPREEMPIGFKAKMASASHHLFPDFTERVAANASHRQQMELAPPMVPTDGTLFTPMKSGTGIDGGMRREMQEQDAVRKEVRAERSK